MQDYCLQNIVGNYYVERYTGNKIVELFLVRMQLYPFDIYTFLMCDGAIVKHIQ